VAKSWHPVAQGWHLPPHGDEPELQLCVLLKLDNVQQAVRFNYLTKNLQQGSTSLKNLQN